VITPNRDELALLTGRPVTTAAELADAARALACELADAARRLDAGRAPPGAAGTASGRGSSPTGPVVLATGGRLGGSESVDVVATADSVTALAAPRVTTANVAGTGDTLSAAVAAGLAHGLDAHAAIAAAKAFVSRAVAGSAGWAMGGGRGPIDHLGWSTPDARSR
jgi:hydroxymethylpyrimidine/phosphomethylpyrimidine kinase